MAKRIDVSDLDIYYGNFLAVQGVNVSIEPRTITALIGPSGCGKSTFLRSLNRMHEVIPGARVEGKVVMDGQDLYGADVDPVDVRRQIGMVFQRPNPFPTMSIYDNVAAGVRLNAKKMKKSELDDLVERSLRGANLWDEVKDRLDRPGAGLSGGQQQRLCIARAIAVEPDVLLMDEPCSALDPISTLAIEDLMAELKERFTIVIVTHNMQQAARVSEHTGFFNLAGVGQPGPLIEFNPTEKIFSNPDEKVDRGLHLRPLRLSPSGAGGRLRGLRGGGRRGRARRRRRRRHLHGHDGRVARTDHQLHRVPAAGSGLQHRAGDGGRDGARLLLGPRAVAHERLLDRARLVPHGADAEALVPQRGRRRRRQPRRRGAVEDVDGDLPGRHGDPGTRGCGRRHRRRRARGGVARAGLRRSAPLDVGRPARNRRAAGSGRSPSRTAHGSRPGRAARTTACCRRGCSPPGRAAAPPAARRRPGGRAGSIPARAGRPAWCPRRR